MVTGYRRRRWRRWTSRGWLAAHIACCTVAIACTIALHGHNAEWVQITWQAIALTDGISWWLSVQLYRRLRGE